MANSRQDEIAKLEALFSEHPEGRVFTHLAEAYRKAGELDKAREILEHGLKRHPDYSSAHVVLGRVLQDLGERGGARDAYARVLQLDPHNLVALRNLGDLHRAAGEPDDAARYYRDLLALDPGNQAVEEILQEIDTGAGASAEAAAGEPVASSDEGTLGGGTEYGMVSFDEEEPSAAEEPGAEAEQPTEVHAELHLGGYTPTGDETVRIEEEVPADEGLAGTVEGGGEEASAEVGEVAEPEEPVGEIEAAGPQHDEPVTATYEGEVLIPEDELGHPEDEIEAEVILEPDTGDEDFLADDFMEALEEEQFPDTAGEELPGFMDLEATPEVEEPSFEEPSFEESSFEEPSFEESSLGEPELAEPELAEPELEEPELEEPSFEESSLSEPELEEPALGEASLDAPAPEEPAPWEPSLDEPAPDEPELDEPAPEEPFFEQAALEEPAALEAEQPSIEEPVSAEAAAVEGPAAEEAAGHEEVATETMGDLYFRQGLYSHAADVYRTLLDHRPGDPRLGDKLAEAERKIAGARDEQEDVPLRSEWGDVSSAREPAAQPEAPAPWEAPTEEAPAADAAEPWEVAEEPPAEGTAGEAGPEEAAVEEPAALQEAAAPWEPMTEASLVDEPPPRESAGEEDTPAEEEAAAREEPLATEEPAPWEPPAEEPIPWQPGESAAPEEPAAWEVAASGREEAEEEEVAYFWGVEADDVEAAATSLPTWDEAEEEARASEESSEAAGPPEEVAATEGPSTADYLGSILAWRPSTPAGPAIGRRGGIVPAEAGGPGTGAAGADAGLEPRPGVPADERQEEAWDADEAASQPGWLDMAAQAPWEETAEAGDQEVEAPPSMSAEPSAEPFAEASEEPSAGGGEDFPWDGESAEDDYSPQSFMTEEPAGDESPGVLDLEEEAELVEEGADSRAAAPPAGGAERPVAGDRGEDDEDLEMFRSWLQSLKR